MMEPEMEISQLIRSFEVRIDVWILIQIQQDKTLIIYDNYFINNLFYMHNPPPLSQKSQSTKKTPLYHIPSNPLFIHIFGYILPYKNYLS